MPNVWKKITGASGAPLRGWSYAALDFAVLADYGTVAFGDLEIAKQTGRLLD